MKLWIDFFLPGIFIFMSFNVFGESVTFVNRSGQTLETIQTSPAGSQTWSDDLIPSSIVLDGESILIDLRGASPWSFRLVDSMGVPYVIYNVKLEMTGKVVVGPQHQARFSVIAGPERMITLLNATDYSLTSLKISKSSQISWGSDILDGRTLAPGESAQIVLLTERGSLSFDIQYILIDGTDDLSFQQSGVILTDESSLVIQIPAQ